MLKYSRIFTLLLLTFNSFLTAENSIETVKETAQQAVKAFSAKYNLKRKSDSVGEAIMGLEFLKDGTAKYSYKTNANWFIFSDRREEYSLLSFNNYKLIPSHYFFNRKGTGRNKKYEWLFDLEQNIAKNLRSGENKSIVFPENFQDKLSYHLQLRLDLINNPQQLQFRYPVIGTSGTIKEYLFERAGIETLDLPFGTISAIKLKREVETTKKTTLVWFAPELNYLLVKIYQLKKGKPEFDVELKSIEIIDDSQQQDISLAKASHIRL